MTSSETRKPRRLANSVRRLPGSRGPTLGEEGDGWAQTQKTLNGGRISMPRSRRLAQGAFEAAKSYATEREQFDRPISKFDAVRDKIVEMDRKSSALAC